MATIARKAQQEAASDPLADLRGGEDRQPTPTDPEPLEARPLASVPDRDASRAEVIAAWHRDTVATGFLHKGGHCGCRYLADRALDAVAPVQPNDDEGQED